MPSISGWSQTAVETRPILSVWARTCARAVHDLAAREAAHRQVVVAGPAEAAHARAAARDLDHELHRHLGVGRQDHRLGQRHLARPAALADHRSRGRRRPPRCRRRGSGPRSATGRRSRPSRRAASRPCRGPSAPRSASIIFGTSALALAHGDQVGEGRQRLGVQEHRRAAQEHERDRVGPRSSAAQRDAGEAQHLEHVQVVVLERDREGQHVEVARSVPDSKLVRRGRCARGLRRRRRRAGRRARRATSS